MRKIAIIAVILTIGVTTVAEARDVYVRGYVRRDGTYVEPYVRTAPNDTKLDNYSTAPNINPYTGRQGTVDPYATPYYSPPTMYTQPSYSPPTMYTPPAPYQPYVNPYLIQAPRGPCFGYGC